MNEARMAFSRCTHYPQVSKCVRSEAQEEEDNLYIFFYVLLTVHLSIFILVINQHDAQNLFYNKFISCLYMFRTPCAHRQEGKIVLYSLWYHHTYRWPSSKNVTMRLLSDRLTFLQEADWPQHKAKTPPC